MPTSPLCVSMYICMPMYRHVHVTMCTFVCMYACTGVWRPEADIEFLPQLHFILFFETKSLSLSVHWFG